MTSSAGNGKIKIIYLRLILRHDETSIETPQPIGTLFLIKKVNNKRY